MTSCPAVVISSVKMAKLLLKCARWRPSGADEADEVQVGSITEVQQV